MNGRPAPAPLVVGGVPEHLNLPWYRAVESGGLPGVTWVDQPSGTGQMVRALADGVLDLAVVLTEGAVAAIAGGNPARIVARYLGSPLRWGVHVAGGSSITDEEAAARGRFAISRPGSGSQLMAHVFADRVGAPAVGPERFVEVGDLEGARRALADGRADVFLWDRFMTSPLVQSGEWRLVGEQPTPWPAFVVVAGPGSLGRLDEVHTALARVWDEARDLMTDPQTPALVAERFGLTLDEARAWFDAVRWDEPEPVEPPVVAGVVAVLRRVGILDRDVAPEAVLV